MNARDEETCTQDGEGSDKGGIGAGQEPQTMSYKKRDDVDQDDNESNLNSQEDDLNDGSENSVSDNEDEEENSE